MFTEDDPTKYFGGISQPKVTIPTTDAPAWQENREYRWVYCKPTICDLQRIDCGFAAHFPEKLPVIIKPVVNLLGGSHGVISAATYSELIQKLSHTSMMWMEFLRGCHWTVDVAVVKGKPVWHQTIEGIEGSVLGSFDQWHTAKTPLPVYAKTIRFIRKHLPAYNGMVNLEFKGSKIIECHLRDGDTWMLGGAQYINALKSLYERGKWPSLGSIQGYLLPVFVKKSDVMSLPKWLIDVVSTSTTWVRVDPPDDWQANPPSLTRLCQVVSRDRNEGEKARQYIRQQLRLGSK